MTLNDLQHQAWAMAEAKGFHDDLREKTPSRRNKALYELTWLYCAVTEIAQFIKRHDIPGKDSEDWETLHECIDDAQLALGTFTKFLHTGKGNIDDPDNEQDLPRQVRLVLIHTEIDEAAAAKPHSAEFAGELADIAIRLGDLAEGSGIDLGRAVTYVMAKNAKRPRLYGTPGEEKR